MSNFIISYVMIAGVVGVFGALNTILNVAIARGWISGRRHGV